MMYWRNVGARLGCWVPVFDQSDSPLAFSARTCASYGPASVRLLTVLLVPRAGEREISPCVRVLLSVPHVVVGDGRAVVRSGPVQLNFNSNTAPVEVWDVVRRRTTVGGAGCGRRAGGGARARSRPRAHTFDIVRPHLYLIGRRRCQTADAG